MKPHSLPAVLAATTASPAPAADPAGLSPLDVLRSGADLHDKARACQQLAVSGDSSAVPVLADLLENEPLASYARTALEAIPGPEATTALRQALARLQARPLTGVVNSIAVRRDPESVPALLEILRDPARGAAPEAVAALGCIANEEAVAALRSTLSKGPPELIVPAAHAAIHAARELELHGDRPASLALLHAVVAASLPGHLHDTASRLAGKAGGKPPGTPVLLFDGKSLDGWEGDATWFRVEDQSVVAGRLDRPIPQNEFLCTRGEYGDFELRLKVLLTEGKGNGGVQFRSQRVPGNREMAGYQADLGENYWGGLYDESRRNKFLGQVPDPAAFRGFVKPTGWNDYVIRCEGARIRLWLNGRLTVDYTEPDKNIPTKGRIGLQIHSGPPCEARYKDILIRDLSQGRGS